MIDTDAMTPLHGKLLIAMPGMGDPRFSKSVVYLCSHDDDGAMGLIINKPSSELTFNDLMIQLSLPRPDTPSTTKVHFGGPVEMGRGFVLHSTDYGSNESTMSIDDDIGMTATRDILEDMAGGQGPEQAILALGYSGWGPGQLESEIMGNGWLTCDASADLIFGLPNEEKWEGALKSLGIDPLLLSSSAGHA